MRMRGYADTKYDQMEKGLRETETQSRIWTCYLWGSGRGSVRGEVLCCRDNEVADAASQNSTLST